MGGGDMAHLLQDILFLGFNQDRSCLAIGNRRGFAIFSMETCSLLVYEACGEVRLVEMLFKTSLAALVGGPIGTVAGDEPAARRHSDDGEPCGKWLTMWNTQSRSSICQVGFDAEICGVRVNHRRVVVLLPHKIHILDLRTMKVLNIVDRLAAPSVDPSLSSLCADPERGYLATPLAAWSELPEERAAGEGFVAVVDTHTLRHVGTVLAHQTPVQALCWSANGTLLATASSRGTVVRVFAAPSLAVVYTFRRGMNPCRILGLSFSEDSAHICAAAASGTCHIFQLKEFCDAKALAPEASLPEDASPSAERKLAEPPLVGGHSIGGDIEELGEWNVVAEQPELMAKLGANISSDGPASCTKTAKSLLWQLLQPWQEKVDAPCAFAWLRLDGDTGGTAGAEPRASPRALAADPGFRYQAFMTSRPFAGAGDCHKVIVATGDGRLRIFKWSPSAGGEGFLLATRQLSDWRFTFQASGPEERWEPVECSRRSCIVEEELEDLMLPAPALEAEPSRKAKSSRKEERRMAREEEEACRQEEEALPSQQEVEESDLQREPSELLEEEPTSPTTSPSSAEELPPASPTLVPGRKEKLSKKEERRRAREEEARREEEEARRSQPEVEESDLQQDSSELPEREDEAEELPPASPTLVPGRKEKLSKKEERRRAREEEEVRRREKCQQEVEESDLQPDLQPDLLDLADSRATEGKSDESPQSELQVDAQEACEDKLSECLADGAQKCVDSDDGSPGAVSSKQTRRLARRAQGRGRVR